MTWLAQSERAFAVFILQVGIVCCYPSQTFGERRGGPDIPVRDQP